MSVHYQNVNKIEAVVRGFESCTTARDEFGHCEHLLVALHYLNNSTVAEATAKMRAGLLRFLDHHEVPREKYNETITVFWLNVVSAFLNKNKTAPERMDSSRIVNLAGELLKTYGDSSFIFNYYSRERVSSSEAKSAWLEPDLKQFDF